jgi:hypothetical protein
MDAKNALSAKARQNLEQVAIDARRRRLVSSLLEKPAE